VSSPSDPQPSVEPAGRTSTSTQEIPFVQPGPAQTLPPHPGAAAPSPVAMEEPQPTGPVDFVPGLPGTPPVPPAATAAPPPAATPAPEAPAQPTVTDAPATAPGPVWPDTLDAAAGRPRKERRTPAPRSRSTAVALVLAVLSLALLEIGLSLGFGAESYWSSVPLWSAFATLSAVLGVVAVAASLPSGGRLRPAAFWRVGAGGLVGLAVFWLLVVLPVVASDRGFVLTAALGALGAALWVGPGRKG